MKNWCEIIGVMFLMVIMNCFPVVIQSQEIDAMEGDTVPVIAVPPDSLEWPEFMPNDSSFFTASPDSSISPISPASPSFKPNPTKAVLYSAILPGLGQAYNRKYWKLPLVYGGFMGFTYAITWNNKIYQDCAEAYKDLTFDLANYPTNNESENWHQSWQNFVSAGVDPSSRFNANFNTQLKRWRDVYRRNRDLSIILAVGFYLICMADAYVDAQLFDFDISPDLSMHIEPVILPQTSFSPRLYGFNCSINF